MWCLIKGFVITQVWQPVIYKKGTVEKIWNLCDIINGLPYSKMLFYSKLKDRRMLFPISYS